MLVRSSRGTCPQRERGEGWSEGRCGSIACGVHQCGADRSSPHVNAERAGRVAFGH